MENCIVRNTLNIIYVLLAAVVAMTGVVSCTFADHTPKVKVMSDADSLVDRLDKERNYTELLSVVDSLEAKKAITDIKADYMRAIAYHNLAQHRAAVFYYRRVFNAGLNQVGDTMQFLHAASYLSMLLKAREDYDGALSVALPVVNALEEAGFTRGRMLSHLKSTIGLCQINLGSVEEGEHNLVDAYRMVEALAETDSTSKSNDDMAMTALNAATNYLNCKQYEKAATWMERGDSALMLYLQRPDRITGREDVFKCRFDLMEAILQYRFGHKDKANAAYVRYLSTDYSKTRVGKIDACEYLALCNRWEEAADNYSGLDTLLTKWGRELNLENIQQLVLPKFRAEANAGRVSDAMETANMLCDALDSAIVWQKNSDAVELATIYKTQEKERQIAHNEAIIASQTATLTRQRAMMIVIVLVILIILFFVVSEYRKRTAKRLAAMNEDLKRKNAELLLANERAEEASRMKTDFIHQISHEIRTPLNLLSGFSQVLTTSEGEIDDATRNDINHQIIENTERITNMVGKMLQLSEASSKSALERNDEALPIQIAMRAVDRSGILAASHLDFTVNNGPESDTRSFITNLKMSTTALTFLLDNAVKFTKPSELSQADKQKASLSIEVSEDKVTFVVENTGKTIPTAEAEHIFKEFVQLDSYYEGTGLGLAVARGLVRRLGGDIILDTTYTEGARFIMTLPF